MKDKKGFTLNQKVRIHIFGYTLLAYPLLLFIVLYLYGSINGLLLSFQSVDYLGEKTWVGFSNYVTFIKNVFTDGDVVGISMWNSLRGWFLSELIHVPLGILFAYFIFKKVKGHKLMNLIFLLPTIVSGFVYTLVFKQFTSTGLVEFMNAFGVENFPRLMDEPKYAFELTCFYGIWCGFGMSIIAYSNAMNGIDPAIFESAQIDGMYTIFQELRYIILPLILPTIVTFLITSVACIFTSAGYVVAFYYTAAPEQAYNMGYWLFNRLTTNLSTNDGYGVLAAAQILLAFLIFPVMMLLRKLSDKVAV